MKRKLALISLGILPALLFLILKYKGMMIVPSVIEPNVLKDVYRFIPSIIISILFSLMFAFNEEIVKKLKPKDFKSPSFFQHWWILIAWSVPISLSLSFILVFHRYHENIQMLNLPLMVMFYGNYAQRSPFNSYELCLNQYVCSNETIWRKVFRLRGQFMFFYGIFLMPIILNDKESYITLILLFALPLIVEAITYFYAKTLYNQLKK